MGNSRYSAEQIGRAIGVLFWKIFVAISVLTRLFYYDKVRYKIKDSRYAKIFSGTRCLFERKMKCSVAALQRREEVLS